LIVYVLPSSDADVPAETSELGSLYVTEEVAGTEVASTLMDAAIEHARAAGQGVSLSGCAERTAGLVASTRKRHAAGWR
jgi:GNAT superfamily N-acetyltransferase